MMMHTQRDCLRAYTAKHRNILLNEASIKFDECWMLSGAHKYINKI